MENNTPTPEEKTVNVPESRLNALISANEEMKADLISLIKNVNEIATVIDFKGLQGGTASLMMKIPGIMKKLNSAPMDGVLNQLTALTEKYGLQV